MFASMGNFGISLGFPAGLLTERFSVRWTSFVATIVSTSGFLLLWSTTLSKDFYHDHAWLQYIYFFIAGKSTGESFWDAFFLINYNEIHVKR
jgi:hypothetical protein